MSGNEREGLRERLEKAASEGMPVGLMPSEVRTLLSLLTQAQEPVGWYDPQDVAEASIWFPVYLTDDCENATRPLYASPVASAPEEEREDANEYRPWESMGITELAYWKQRYIEARQEVSETEALREALEEIAALDWRYASTNMAAYEAHKIARRALAQHVGGEG